MDTTITPDVSVTEAYTTPADKLVVKFSNGARIRSNRTYTYVLVESWTPDPAVEAVASARVVSATMIADKALRWRQRIYMEGQTTHASSGSRWDRFVLQRKAGGTYEVMVP